MPAISRNGKFLTKTKTGADIGGVSSVRLYEKQTGSQGSSSYTVFTMSGAYVPGSNTLTVFVNGQKAERVDSSPANATQYVETSEKVVTFGASLQTTDIVEFIIFGSYPVYNRDWNTNTYETTLTETTDEVELPFNPNALMSVYIDGVRQQSDAYTLSGTTITFSESLTSGTKLLFVSPNTDDVPLTNADTLDGYHAIQLMGRRNIIINGNAMLAQRGTSLNHTSTGGMVCVDRFRVVNTSEAQYLLTQGSEVATPNLRNNISVTCTTADTSIAAGNATGIQYVIEGYDILPIIGKVCTLSFWVKTTYAGVYCVALTNYSGGSTDRSYVTEFTLPADTWTYRTMTFVMSDLSTGTYWNVTNSGGLRIWFTLLSGTTYITGTTNSWHSGNYIATSNQVNFAGATSRVFSITGLQLEAGSRATEFEHLSASENFRKCQRYYEKSYKYSVAPGTNTGLGTRTCFCMSTTDISRLFLNNQLYMVEKREIPTSIVIYSEDGTAGNVSLYNNNTTKIAISSLNGQTEKHLGHYFQMATNAAAGSAYVFHFTADSEI